MYIVRVNHEVKWQKTFLEDPSSLLHLIRSVVCDLRDNPQLAGYRLYDIGMQRKQGKLELNFYYRQCQQQSETA